MCQVRDEQVSKQKKKAEMIRTWQFEVSCDRNLTQLSQGELHDLLSMKYEQINPKKDFDLSYKQKSFQNPGMIFISKTMNNISKNGKF